MIKSSTQSLFFSLSFLSFLLSILHSLLFLSCMHSWDSSEAPCLFVKISSLTFCDYWWFVVSLDNSVNGLIIVPINSDWLITKVDNQTEEISRLFIKVISAHTLVVFNKCTLQWSLDIPYGLLCRSESSVLAPSERESQTKCKVLTFEICLIWTVTDIMN